MDEQPTEADIKEFQELQGQFAEIYYSAIGKGISAWSETEGHLVVVAAFLLDTTIEKAGLVLYSINNFHTWLSIIDELFAMDPRGHALRPDWLDIANRLKKLNDTRVRLAHHAVHRGTSITEHIESGGEDLPWLRPNRYDTRGKSRKHAPLQIDQLASFIADLAPLSTKLTELMQKMSPKFLDSKRRVSQILRQTRLQAHYTLAANQPATPRAALQRETPCDPPPGL